ncbi:MAG: signal recognition particle-docking protein FtsY [Chloroflexi bacterium]|nr:signal recognition particle-docking protein FtsY [Chloroflexota bacterium]
MASPTKWSSGLERTSRTAFGRLASLLGFSEINENLWEEVEAGLIQADLGIETTNSVIRSLKRIARDSGLTRADLLAVELKRELRSTLSKPAQFTIDQHPTIILIVGVNGSGKTTTIAKLAHRFQQENFKVLLGAADTFRAAAVDQLQVWAERLGLDLIAGAPESDPGAVAFNCIQAGLARRVDVILIDTAGRLHTRFNLMQELQKVHRVVGKAVAGAPHQVWLVLDATTGQNALPQARAFKEAVHVNGVILAKLDTSARGGMAFSIQRELGLPILFAGLGEQPEDLIPFDPDAFVDGILSKN